MSSASQERRAQQLRDLTRELRQFTGLSAEFFRAAAARLGMTVTDVQVIDLLESAGPLTAGQLADLTGLTTGAITGMLNRLEKSGLVLRERDPDDARRVIVRLAPGQETLRDIRATLDSLGMAWDDVVSGYDEERISFLLEVLKRGGAQTREEIIRLRAAPQGEEGSVSAPLGDLASGQLIVTGSPRLILRADEGMTELYQASFEGAAPEVKTKEGTVTIRYPKRLLPIGKRHDSAEVTLSAAIPWRILVQGSAAEIGAELSGLILAELDVKGSANTVRLELPAPTGVVPVRITGYASEIVVRRPVGVAARVHLRGWVSEFIFDDQTFSAVGNDMRMQSRDYEAAAPYYDIELASTASMVTVTTA
ncbi:MAG TPA: MarR family transcriptional regulator [Ktedonobacterales bacterium]|jgi:DNA-binding MarR family transcriptional regulator|nr:MarR family transcriptional regulator [Ktedonobacterales bacterium]